MFAASEAVHFRTWSELFEFARTWAESEEAEVVLLDGGGVGGVGGEGVSVSLYEHAHRAVLEQLLVDDLVVTRHEEEHPHETNKVLKNALEEESSTSLPDLLNEIDELYSERQQPPDRWLLRPLLLRAAADMLSGQAHDDVDDATCDPTVQALLDAIPEASADAVKAMRNDDMSAAQTLYDLHLLAAVLRRHRAGLTAPLPWGTHVVRFLVEHCYADLDEEDKAVRRLMSPADGLVVCAGLGLGGTLDEVVDISHLWATVRELATPYVEPTSLLPDDGVVLTAAAGSTVLRFESLGPDASTSLQSAFNTTPEFGTAVVQLVKDFVELPDAGEEEDSPVVTMAETTPGLPNLHLPDEDFGDRVCLAVFSAQPEFPTQDSARRRLCGGLLRPVDMAERLWQCECEPERMEVPRLLFHVIDEQHGFDLARAHPGARRVLEAKTKSTLSFNGTHVRTTGGSMLLLLSSDVPAFERATVNTLQVARKLNHDLTVEASLLVEGLDTNKARSVFWNVVW